MDINLPFLIVNHCFYVFVLTGVVPCLCQLGVLQDDDWVGVQVNAF